MKLIEIKLCNFRQFYDENRIPFSTDPEQNVTVIHGENGAGKTSLLNAFKWCFYGHTDFDTGTDNILNEHAITKAQDSDGLHCYVEIQFDHDNFKYTAKRTCEFAKGDGMSVSPIGGEDFSLTWIDENGAFQKSSNPQSQINQILPEKMHSYFFFNGERIEKLAFTSASHEIREAIKSIMGLEILERGKVHLSTGVKRYFSKQMKQGAPKELQSAIDTHDMLEDKISDLKEQLGIEIDNIREFKDELQIIQNKLKKISKVSKHQEEREATEKRLEEVKTSISDRSADIRRLISTTGFSAFIGEASNHVLDLLEDRRKKGELPYKVKKQFIDDLLSSHKCICGSPLTEGSAARAEIEKFRNLAGGSNLEEAYIRTYAALSRIESTREDLFKRLRELVDIKKELFDERKKLNGKLDDLSKEFSSADVEDAVNLEARRVFIDTQKEESLKREGMLREKIREYEREVEDAKQEVQKQQDKSTQSLVAQKRHNIVEECARVLDELHHALSDLTKEQLSQRVNDTFKKIIRKEYKAEIDDDYTLRILKEIPGHGFQVVHEKSTGESQITSLSFIASIVSLAREHNRSGQFFRGGVFPIVMDSPFGALDPDYRALIAKYVPELAEQTIILVTQSQWNGEVADECKSRVGQHISLIYNAPTVNHGDDSYYVRQGAEFEHTLVEEGYHG